MPTVRFVPDSKEVRCNIGDYVLEIARSGGVDILGPCGGKASCGRCVIKIINGSNLLTYPTEEERSILGWRKLSEGFRLACRCKILSEGTVTVHVPSDSRALEHVLLVEGYLAEEVHDPLIRKIEVLVSKKGNHSVLRSLVDNLPTKDLVFDTWSIKRLSRILEDEEKKICLILHGNEVLDVRDCIDGVFGFAVDVGTTKLAGYLVDIIDGETLAATAEINPQTAYGEDVVSRITYAIKNGVEDLNKKVIEGINTMIEKTCNLAGVHPDEIYEVVAVGNTVMHHTLLGLDLRSLAFFPYTPIIKEQMYMKASDIGLNVNTGARLFLPPLIAGYIGSDVVADILATGIHRENLKTMLIDIGTNTEIVIGTGERFLACSTASGPAFEGAHVKFGMRAAKGAIDRVEISRDGDVSYTVIGGGKPMGLTGSAVIDAIAELYDVGIIDKTGRFCQGRSRRLRIGEEGYLEFVIAYGDETALGVDIVITQKDVREIQLAKAAIRTGINILLKKVKMDERELENIYVAGAFGFFINPVSAIKIGMFPNFNLDKIRLVGNTAGMGAKMMLLSKKIRDEAVELVKQIEYVELATETGFQSEFIKSISLSEDL